MKNIQDIKIWGGCIIWILFGLLIIWALCLGYYLTGKDFDCFKIFPEHQNAKYHKDHGCYIERDCKLYKINDNTRQLEEKPFETLPDCNQ